MKRRDWGKTSLSSPNIGILESLIFADPEMPSKIPS